MLPKKLSLLSPCQHPAASSSFSTTTKPDIFICIQGEVIPAQRKKLQQSNWIRNAGKQKNILVPSQSLNPKIIQIIIAYYDGSTIEIADTNCLTDLFEAVQYMGIKSLECKLEEQIINQLKQFDTFLLLEIAFKFELQKLALICFQYLQIQEFQQMKYFQYALFDCDFKLFQIILRRHHVLKMRKKIEGLPAQDIQQLVLLYCKRHHYPKQIQQKLLQKYVFSLRIQSEIEQSKIKNSLRLHKQLNKNLGQSTTIYGNDSQKREKQLQVEMKTAEKGRDLKNMRPQSNPVRMRKYSMEMDKFFSQMGLSNRRDGLNVFPYSEKVIKVDEVIVQEQQCLNEYATVVHFDTQHMRFRNHNRKEEKIMQYFSDQISEIGNKGSLELKIHEIEQQMIKKPNTKSMMFQDVIEQSVQQSMQQKSRKNNNFVASKNVKTINFRRY